MAYGTAKRLRGLGSARNLRVGSYKLTGRGRSSLFINPTTYGRNAFFNVTQVFFDKPRVINSMDRATLTALSRFGAYVMRDARRSLRPAAASTPPSTPPAPPRSRTGLLKYDIFFAYEKSRRTVIIGPVQLPRTRHDNLWMLEFGGRREMRIPLLSNAQRFERYHAKRKSRKKLKDARGRFVKQRPSEPSEDTSPQVPLQMVRRIATYEARPFMRPAFWRNIDKAHKLFKDAMY